MKYYENGISHNLTIENGLSIFDTKTKGMKKYRISLLFLPIVAGLAFLCLQESNDKQTNLLTNELLSKMIKVIESQNMRYTFGLLSELDEKKGIKLDSAWIDDLDVFEERFIGFDSIETTFMAELKPLMQALVDTLEENLNPEVRRRLPQLCEYALEDNQLGSDINWVQFRAKCLRNLNFQNALYKYNKKFGFSDYCNLKLFNQVFVNEKDELILKVGFHRVVSDRELCLSIGTYKDSLKDVYKLELPIKDIEAADRMVNLSCFNNKWKNGPVIKTEIKYQLK